MACHHCGMMSEYYAARNAQEAKAEDYSNGYRTEKREFYDSVERRFTFKEFLIGRSRVRS